MHHRFESVIRHIYVIKKDKSQMTSVDGVSPLSIKISQGKWGKTLLLFHIFEFGAACRFWILRRRAGLLCCYLLLLTASCQWKAAWELRSENWENGFWWRNWSFWAWDGSWPGAFMFSMMLHKGKREHVVLASTLWAGLLMSIFTSEN